MNGYGPGLRPFVGWQIVRPSRRPAGRGIVTRPIEWKNIILYGEYNLDPNKVKTP